MMATGTDKTDRNKELQHLYVNITSRCNFRCFYCYDEASRRELTSLAPSLFEQVASDAKRVNTTTVTITGGEPLLHKDWYVIASCFKKHDININLSTNGSLVGRNVEKIKDLAARVQISFDGDNDAFNYVTGTKGTKTFKRVLDAIATLKNNDVKVMLNAVLGKHNLSHIDYLADLSQAYCVPIRVTFLNSTITTKDTEDKLLSIIEIDQLIGKVTAYHGRYPDTKLYLSLPPLLAPTGHRRYVNPACGWARHVGGILANGDVTVCGIASGIPELVAGNVRDESFYNIWVNSPLLRNLRSRTHDDLKGICGFCPVREQCVGGCRLDAFARYGDLNGPLHLCQTYYDALLDGKLGKKEFPSKMLRLAS